LARLWERTSTDDQVDTRNRYSAEFKAKVALEAIRGELTVSQLGAKYGVHQTMIKSWKNQAIDKLSTVFEQKSERKDARCRGREITRENRPAGRGA
jgi:transposase-like protein